MPARAGLTQKGRPVAPCHQSKYAEPCSSSKSHSRPTGQRPATKRDLTTISERETYLAQVDNTGDAHASSSSAMQTNPLKRARLLPRTLTVTTRPEVTSKDGETANQQGRDDSTSKGKGKGKQVAAKLQRKSLAIERPEWAASGSSKPAKSASHGSSSSSNHTDGCATVERGLDTAVATAGPSGVILSQSSSTVSVLNANSTWPAITNWYIRRHKQTYADQPATIMSVSLSLDQGLFAQCANHLKPGSGKSSMTQNDQQYIMKLTPLPRARICLIRSEVKERCNIITMASFIALGQEPNIIEYVWAALANAPSGLVMRSRPYRNERVINLYATIYEWRTGEQQIAEFSANAYLDVYHGHINTLNHIRTNPSTVNGNEANTGVPIAELNLNEMMADCIFLRSQHLL
ncbi:hypothetical protein EI94DRAFT_1710727 [Lactarius quietus]|nr:hypothetical protein EI94DRAFT_1710727 [Lactarius quietus]